MAQDPADSGGGGSPLKSETLLGIIGAAAALGLWINVVGGAVLWTRFVEADLPATHVVGLVPNTTLVGVGLQALALPLLVASVAVGVFYVVRREPAPAPPVPPSQAALSAPPPGGPGSAQRFRDVLAALLILAAARRLPRAPPPPTSPPPPAPPPAAAAPPASASSPAPAPPLAPAGPPTGMPGFGMVLLLLFALGMVAVFATFGGEVHLPKHKEYVFAWALASPFLVVGAATYKPVALHLRSRWPRPIAAYAVIAAVGLAAIVGVGIWVDHVWAASYVALLSPVAAVLAYRLPPGKRWVASAGGWLVTIYLGLGIALFFGSHGGVGLHPDGDEAAILLAVLMTTIALLFLHVVGERSSNAHVVAAVMFAVVAVWGGGINYLQERVTTPTFELTAMLRKPQDSVAREPVSGFLIARTGDAILVATTSEALGGSRRIVVLPRDEVTTMAVGRSCVINTDNVALAARMAEELEADERATSSPAGVGRCTKEQ
jgi:hypothetical protein